jgi:thiamine pyrophosphokinase
MNIQILAGGPGFLIPELNKDEKDAVWVGVDRGVYELMRRGIRPDYAFGDFDSLSETEKQVLSVEANIFTFPQEKDQTDLELAVNWAIEQHPETITVYGATGGRLDHEWANLSLLQKSIGTETEMMMVDKQNRIVARAPGNYQIKRDSRYPYVSFLPLGESIKSLTLKGFKYPLEHIDVERDSTLTVSNEITEEKGTYSFTAGIVMIVRSRDDL